MIKIKLVNFMETDLNPKDIVKYKAGQTYYILERLDFDENIAYIKHKNGIIYKVRGIERLERVENVTLEEFNLKIGHIDFVKKIYGFDFQFISDLNGEIWKEISFLKGLLVSNLGRIKSTLGLKGETLLQFYKNENDHNFIRINKYENEKEKTYYYNVTHIVALAFILNPKRFKYATYKDGDPDNNYVENIEWTESGVFQYNPKNKRNHLHNNYFETKDYTELPEYGSYYKYGGPVDEYGDRIYDDFIDDVLDGFSDAIWNIT